MKIPMSRAEIVLLLALAAAVVVAACGPAVAQQAHYHAFADQRAWWGVPFAMDVLSNLPFAMAGVWGLWVLRRVLPNAQATAHRPMAALFCAGLIVTAVCSSLYHWQPDNAGLMWDRFGMVLAFAGLLGLAVADRISARAAWVVAATVMVLGPVCVALCANTGNLLPWAVLQGGGMLLVVALAAHRPVAAAWGVSLGTVIAVYALAKVLELGDHTIFEWTHGLVSGHSLKHVVAALAAWPVIDVMHNVLQGQWVHASQGAASAAK